MILYILYRSINPRYPNKSQYISIMIYHSLLGKPALSPQSVPAPSSRPDVTSNVAQNW